MINGIINYAQGMECQPDVFTWITTHLTPYLDKNQATGQSEVEHIIDYMASDKRPVRISKMSYVQAKANTDKWNKALIKKGADIKESPKDVEVIREWKEGFKIVKLVGENAYKREGFLMRHCSGSYFGKGKEVYSLRDKDNNPHATLEAGQQIKGKGNGPIHPKYIKYIVAFLEEIGMTVGDNEMKNLGYVNVEKIQSKLHKSKNNFFNKKYLYQEDDFYAVDGEKYDELDIWQYKPLVTKIGIDAEINIKFNFDISAFLQVATSKLINKTKQTVDKANSTAVANSIRSTAVANSIRSTAVANSYNSTAVANSYNSTAVANREDSTAVANSIRSTAVANSYNSTAVANRSYSTAVANREDSTAVANSYNSTAVANSIRSTAVANSIRSTAVANSIRSTAVANREDSTAVANSYNSTAVANSIRSTAVANSYNSTAVANSYNSTAVANRSYSTAVANSYNSTAVANNKNSIALCRGYNSRAKGKINAWLVLAEYDHENENIINIVSGKVDGKTLKEDTLYIVKNGQFVEAE